MSRRTQHIDLLACCMQKACCPALCCYAVWLMSWHLSSAVLCCSVQVSVTLNRSSHKPTGSSTAAGQPFDLFTPRTAGASAATPTAAKSPLGPQQQQQRTPADLLLAQQQQQEQSVAAADASRQAVKQLFAQHLDGLAPAEESKYTIRCESCRNFVFYTSSTRGHCSIAVQLCPCLLFSCKRVHSCR
jgi:hypothetical protein